MKTSWSARTHANLLKINNVSLKRTTRQSKDCTIYLCYYVEASAAAVIIIVAIAIAVFVVATQKHRAIKEQRQQHQYQRYKLVSAKERIVKHHWKFTHMQIICV